MHLANPRALVRFFVATKHCREKQKQPQQQWILKCPAGVVRLFRGAVSGGALVLLLFCCS